MISLTIVNVTIGAGLLFVLLRYFPSFNGKFAYKKNGKNKEISASFDVNNKK